MAAIEAVWGSVGIKLDGQEQGTEEGRSLEQAATLRRGTSNVPGPCSAVVTVMQEVASWLPPADLRRARCVCRQWRTALDPLATTASVPLQAGTVGNWKQQLGELVRALPYLQELEIQGRLSDVAAQQLTQLEKAQHLRSLKIPAGQDLRDKSLQPIQGLTQLRQLQLHKAAALSSRGLFSLSVLHQLTVLDLKHCGRISWLELQQAWHAACAAFVKDNHNGTAAHTGAGTNGAAAVAGMLVTGGASSGVHGLGPGLAALKRPGSGCFAGHLMVGGRQRDSSTGGALPSPRSAVRRHALAAAKQAFGSPLSSASAPQGQQPDPQDNSSGPGLREGEVGAEQPADGSAGPVNAVPVLTSNLPQSRFRSSSSSSGPSPLAALATTAARSRFSHATSSSNADAPATLSSTPAAGAAAVGGGIGAGGLAAFRTRVSGLGPAALGDVSSFPTDRQTGRPGARFALAALQASEPVIRQASTVAAMAAMPLLRHNSGMGTGAAAVAAAAASSGLAAAAVSGGAGAMMRQRGAFADPSLGSANSSVQLALLAYLGSAEGQDNIKGFNASLERRRGQRSSLLSSLDGGGSGSGGSGVLSRHGSGMGGVSASGEPLSPKSTMRRMRLPAMPFPHLQSLSFTCTDITGGRPVAELSAVADLTRLTSLEMARCQQVTDAAVVQLTKLQRLAQLKMANVWGLTDAGMEAIGALTTLTSLTMLQPNRVTAAGLLGLTELVKLRSLTLSCTQEVGLMTLPWLVCDLPSLVSIDITSSCWADNGCEMVTNGAAQLTSIKLRGCSDLQPAGVEQLAKLPRLQVLLLEDCQHVTCGHVLGSSKLPKTLQQLTLSSCNWGNLFTECLTVPPCAATLVKLSISGVPDVSDNQMRKAVGFFSNLQQLELTASPGLTDASLCALSKLSTLRELDLSGTGVAGDFLAPLQQQTALTQLKLAGCSRLEATAVGALVQLPSLKVLNLAESPLVEDAVLEEVATKCPQLGKLDISGCKHVTAAAADSCPHYVRLIHNIK